MFGDGIVHPPYALSKLIIKKGISFKIRMNKYDPSTYLEFAILPGPYDLNTYLFILILKLMPFFMISLLKVYGGCTIPSPNIEIESKYVRGTLVLVYSLVLSAYVCTYVALHICRCLKCKYLYVCMISFFLCFFQLKHLTNFEQNKKLSKVVISRGFSPSMMTIYVDKGTSLEDR